MALYSEAMVSSGTVWDEASLSAFLADPAKLVPDNNMKEGARFVGRVSSDQHRKDLIAYLKMATTP